jgi:hypothetical protein
MKGSFGRHNADWKRLIELLKGRFSAGFLHLPHLDAGPSAG